MNSTWKKLPVFVTAAAVVFSAMTAQAGKSEGTGVGNGGGGPEDANVKKLIIEFQGGQAQVAPSAAPAPNQPAQPNQPATQPQPGHNGGAPVVIINNRPVYAPQPQYPQPQYPQPGENYPAPGMAYNPMQSVMAWCSRAIPILEREMWRAHIELQFQRFAMARRILKNAMLAAQYSMSVDPRVGGPILRTMAERGVILMTALDSAMPWHDRNTEVSKTNFAIEYVGRMIKAGRTLDRVYFVPWIYRYNRCYNNCPESFNFAMMEKQYLKFAKSQLDFLLNKFAIIEKDEHGRVSNVFPVGNARMFLVLGELVSQYVAMDLSHNLYAYSQACAVSDLTSLAETLAQYNRTGAGFPNEVWALTFAASELDRILGGMSSCRY
ncbi:MAG: hypothetical protein A2583_04200 [Bdellovibrionales bacterium RIFOXYD1_FULL_53_11]|nr:MAG: hypothetical protein A2583_04200 [Bdellovibrionales bacterium RIFOXYD1_FULL_53_11]